MTDTQPLEVRNSIWRNGVPAVLDAGLTAGILFMLLTQDRRFDWLMWLALLVLGAGAVLLGWRTIDRRPIFVIDHKGIHARSRWVRSIAWQDILKAKVFSAGSNSQLLIYPKDVDIWQARLPLLAKLVWKFSPRWRCVNISLLNADCSSAKIAAALAVFNTTTESAGRPR